MDGAFAGRSLLRNDHLVRGRGIVHQAEGGRGGGRTIVQGVEGVMQEGV